MARALSTACGSGFFLGNSPSGPVFAPPEDCVLVLGPPRSGKTSAIVVPNVIAAPAAVLVTSTKPDVMRATCAARLSIGRCLVFDPGGRTELPPFAERIGWSPLASAGCYDEVLLLSSEMTAAARPQSDRGESRHWTERAGTVISCLLHAAALAAEPLPTVLSAVNRHDPGRALAILDEHRAEIPYNSLSGILATDSREQSGIWSTAASVLTAYQSLPAVASAERPWIDPRRFVRSADTVYVVAPSDIQRHAAPLVAGLVHDLRRAAYAAAATSTTARGLGRGRPAQRLTLVLDEVANIAPLQALPQLASEGAGQGVLSLACLQDLSQARARWGADADGFLSIFGTKVVLPGIADTQTLLAISLLAGDHDVVHVAVSRQCGGPRSARRARNYSASWQREHLLEPAAIGRGRAGEALVLTGTTPGRVMLAPYYAVSPWREATRLRSQYPPAPPAARPPAGPPAGGAARAPVPASRPAPPAAPAFGTAAGGVAGPASASAVPPRRGGGHVQRPLGR